MTIRQTILKIRNSTISASSPTQLKTGELAVNIPDKKIWVGDANGTPSLISSKVLFGDIEYSLIQDVRALGVSGGTSRKETWNVRALNTITHNYNNNVSLVGDDFVLKAGTYAVSVIAPADEVKKHKVRVFNETTNTSEFEGITVKSKDGGSIASAVGVIVSNGTDLYEVQHYTEKKHEKDGLGDAMNIGQFEVYTTVEIIKIG